MHTQFRRPDRLKGQLIELEPLCAAHREPLRAASAGDPDIWTYFPLTFNGAGEHFDEWFDYTMERYRAAEHYPFAVLRSADRAVIGTTRFYDMSAIHRRLAIGSTWYSKAYRGTLVHPEVRFLTLSYAFEQLQVNRVELITDPRNLTSQAAMAILGARREGLIRRHLIYRDGRVRDSILYSIISAEWPAVREKLCGIVGRMGTAG